MFGKNYKKDPSLRGKLLRMGPLGQTLLLLLIVGGFIFGAPAAKANQPESAAPYVPIATTADTSTISMNISSAETDGRALKLQSYLEAKGSPLSGYAVDFINAADKYGLDWRLMPAISGNESGFGKAYLLGTYNAWGWGGGYTRFASWTDAIYGVAKGLRDGYASRGLVTPYQIAPVYCPPSTTWAAHVQMYMGEIGVY
jgi:hypothetical protein